MFLSKILPRLFKADKPKNYDSDSTNSPQRIENAGNKYCLCRVILLDDTQQTLNVKANSKGYVLLNKVFDHLNLLEKDYFGLRYLDHTNQTHWLDPTKSLASQMKTAPPHTLYFGVKFYAADPCKLHEEITRYQFFLQVKRDILQGRVPVNFELSAELAAYAVQSELGDYDPARHSQGYISEFRFVPNQSEELEKRVEHIHKALVGKVPAKAENRFLDKVKWLEMYGVDMHPVQGEANTEFFLGLTPTGIVVYKNKTKVGNYFWPRITRIHFKGKMFMIKVRDKNNEGNRYTFECTSKEAGKHLWRCCVEHHAFFRLTSANESYNATGKIFSLGSKYRYSGRTEKQALADSSNRPPPRVLRVPSKRYQRRTPAEVTENKVDAENVKPMEAFVVEPMHKARHRKDGYQSAPDTPWESTDKQGGLYTSGRTSPMSLHSERMFPRRVQSSSEMDSSHKRRRPAGGDSGSESEAGHRRNRRQRRSEESLNYTESHFRDMESRVRNDNYSGPYVLRANGSLSSMASEASQANARRRRRRSRSPGNKKPPEELAQHFKYVDPDQAGISADQLRDIPYTKVETQMQPFRIKDSQHNRRRHRSPKRRSCGDAPEPTEGPHPVRVPVGEAPPPYTTSHSEGLLHRHAGEMAPSQREMHPYPDPQTMGYNDSNIRCVSSSNVQPQVTSHQRLVKVGTVVKIKSLAAPSPTRPGEMKDYGDGHIREDSGLGIEHNSRTTSFVDTQPAYRGAPFHHHHHHHHSPSPQQPYSGSAYQKPPCVSPATKQVLSYQPVYRQQPVTVQPAPPVGVSPLRRAPQPIPVNRPAYIQPPQPTQNSPARYENSPQRSQNVITQI